MIREYLSKYKNDFNNCKECLKSIKTWYKLIPNLLTISRPIGIIPANILFFTGNVIPAVLLTGGLLLTDLFDGKLARKWNVQSELGADLDATGDKLMFLGLALPLMVSYPTLIFNIFFEGVISFVNVLGRIKGLDTKTVYSGKVKTWLLSLTLIAGYLVHFFNIPIAVFGVLMSLTCVSQGYALSEYIRNYKKLLAAKELNTSLDECIKSDSKEYKNECDLSKGLCRVNGFDVYTRTSSRGYTGKVRVRKKIQEKNNSCF